MPTVTVPQDIDAMDAAEKLQQQLGAGYTVDTEVGANRNVFKVRQNALAFASVRVAQAGGATTFRVHGGGFIIGRIVNELGIARAVATAIKNAYPAARALWHRDKAVT